MIGITTFIERRNKMSFNYAYLCSEFLVMGSDSRETFEDGTYNDNRQKTFWNNEQKLCWSYTGLTRMNHIDNIDLVNNIMNSSATIVNKLEFIKHIMCYQTQKYNEICNEDAVFDMLVGKYSDSGISLYVLEVKNGQSNDEQNKVYAQNQRNDFSIASGVHVELWKTVSFVDMESNPIKTTQNLIKKAIKLSEETDKTVGGHSCVVLMRNDGEIVVENEENKR